MHPATIEDLARGRQDHFEREARQARLAGQLPRRTHPSRTHVALVTSALVLLGAVLAFV